jgi:hypothetical protein
MPHSLLGLTDWLCVIGGRTLPKEISDQIVERTDGIPLFIEEFAARTSNNISYPEHATSSPAGGGRREYAKKHNKSWRQADKLVRKHLLPKWAKLKAADITRADAKSAPSQIEVC